MITHDDGRYAFFRGNFTRIDDFASNAPQTQHLLGPNLNAIIHPLTGDGTPHGMKHCENTGPAYKIE